MIDRCLGDERRRLDGDARVTSLPRGRSASSFQGSNFGRVGDMQIGRAVGGDGHRRAELCSRNRSADHTSAIRRPFGPHLARNSLFSVQVYVDTEQAVPRSGCR